MKKTLLIIALSFIYNYSFAQLTFSKVFYEPGIGIQGYSVIQTPDNGFMIAGNNLNGELVMKLDSAGGQVWKKYYNWVGNFYNGLFCISPTDDSCYIVAGAAVNGFDANFFCMKINTVGDTLWTKALLTPDMSQIFSVQQTYDHGYIMAGPYRSATAPYVRNGVMKLDSTGNLEWSQVITSPGNNCHPNTIRQTPDSGYVVWGTVNNVGIGINAYLIKLSPSGTIQWSKTYNHPVPGVMIGCSLEILTDGFISFSIGDANPYGGILMKMDFSGNVTWSKYSTNLNGTLNSFMSKLHQTKDGGFVIAIGYEQPYGPGYLWRADSSGNFLWAKEVHMNPKEAIETSDNGYFILGNGPLYAIAPQPPSDPQIGVIKTDSLGFAPNCINPSFVFGVTDTLVATNLTTTAAPAGTFAHINTIISIPSISEINDCVSVLGNVNAFDSDKHALNISPNPSSGKFTISFKGTIMKGNMEILNIPGESVFVEKIFNESKKEINFKNVSQGIYFVKVFNGEKSYCEKLIIEHD